MKPTHLLIAAMSVVTPAQAGDVLGALEQQASHSYVFRGWVWDNPALAVHHQSLSASTLWLDGLWKNASATPMAQLGRGSRQLNARALTLQHPSENSLIWGKAAYRNGQTYEVRWNETSDFLKLYPYVMADPQGGTLKHEQYELSGGYAWHQYTYSYGAEIGYRARSEYRSRDPRPNNTVADLYANLALAHRFSPFFLALKYEGRKYKQTNELIFMNELGGLKEYHLTGLGTDFSRFSGNNSNNTFYKGYNLGASLDLLPVKGDGLSAHIAYDHFSVEKVLTDLNRLPLNRLRVDTWQAEATWQQADWGLRIQGDHARRKGTDNLFGDGSGNIYPQIGSRQIYEGGLSHLTLTALYEGNLLLPEQAIIVHYTMLPSVACQKIENKHADTANQLNSDDLDIGLQAQLSVRKSHNRIEADLGVNRRANLNNTTVINQSVAPSLQEALQQTGRYLEEGSTRFHAALSFNHQLTRSQVLSLQASWQRENFLKGQHANRWTLSLGFTM